MGRRVVIRGTTARLRTASSFATSGMVHGMLLAWLILAAATQPAERPRNIYQQEIQPFEKHLVWYSLRDRLPDVKPAERHADLQPPRARLKFNQSIVAGKRDDERPPQKIAMPAAAIELPKPLPLPNALAVAAPAVRRFTQPPPPPAPAPVEANLPAAPPLQADLRVKPLDLAVAARPVRPFVAPAERGAAIPPSAPLSLPEAPRLTASSHSVTLPLAAAAAPRRAFVEPQVKARLQRQAPLAELEAPQLTEAAPLPAAVPRIPHGFIPPAVTPKAAQQPATIAMEAPTLPDVSPTPGATVTMAIVGLNPANTPDIPPPPGAHDAGFSAAPKVKPSGSESAANESAKVSVPGLSTRAGVKDEQPTLVSVMAPPTSRQSLLAALHGSIPNAPIRTAPLAGGEPRPARVTSAPDGRLAGRYIYTLAIQMPNVTSYSGSWIVWFAEHQPDRGAGAGDMRAPVAVHKVDPKYIQTAVEERIEGTVRLAAVIRKTGHVDSVELLQHLDARLDRSAEEALAKWEFEPAQHNGAPIDIDAIFEIPFHLAPKPKR